MAVQRLRRRGRYYVRAGRAGSCRGAEAQREMTPKSVTAAVGPSPLDAPIEIGIAIGIGIEPGVFDSVFPSHPLRLCVIPRLPGHDPLPAFYRRRPDPGEAPPSAPLRLWANQTAVTGSRRDAAPTGTGDAGVGRGRGHLCRSRSRSRSRFRSPPSPPPPLRARRPDDGGMKGRRDGGATSQATRPVYVQPGREGSRRDAEAQRDDTEVRCRRRRSVAP